MEENIAERCAAYLRHRMPQATDLTVTDVSRIFGGASCQTYRMKAHWNEGGTRQDRGLIFRRSAESSLIDTKRDQEFYAYLGMYNAGIPVPQPYFIETDEKWFDHPFFVMAEVENCVAATKFAEADPYGKNAQKVAEQFFDILGRIVRLNPEDVPELYNVLDKVEPQDCWRRELDYWEGVIDEDALTPQPIVRAAIRWLRKHPPPPPAKLCFVHGDYRTGNFLYTEDTGDIKAILDWEMVHLGDPLEDLGWATDPLWGDADGRAGKMVLLEEAVRLWEASSGLTVDPLAFLWWKVFSAVKGMGIWLSAGAEYAARRNTDIIMAFSAWVAADAHNRTISQTLLALYQAERAQP